MHCFVIVALEYSLSDNFLSLSVTPAQMEEADQKGQKGDDPDPDCNGKILSWFLLYFQMYKFITEAYFRKVTVTQNK